MNNQNNRGVDDLNLQAIAGACNIISNSVVRLISATYGDDRDRVREIGDQIVVATEQIVAELASAGIPPNVPPDAGDESLDTFPRSLLRSDHNRALFTLVERAYSVAE